MRASRIEAGLPLFQKAGSRGELLLAVEKFVDPHADVAQMLQDDIAGRLVHGHYRPAAD